MSTRTSLIAVSLFTLSTVAAGGCVVVSDDEGDSASSDSAGGTDGGSDSDAGTSSDSGGSDSDPSGGSSTDPSDGSDSDPSSGSDSSDPTAGSGDEPKTGLWEYQGTSFEDGCNIGAQGYQWGGYLLTNNGDETFTVETQSDEAFDCDLLGGGEFFCPDRVGEDPDTQGADATVTVTIVASGTFDTSESGSGVQTAEATCEGPDCPLIEQTLGLTFPCMMVEEFETTWISP